MNALLLRCLRISCEKRNNARMKLIDYLSMHNITQADFAQRIGTTGATVNRIVRGKVTPRRGLMAAISLATEGAVQPIDLLLEEVVPGADAGAAPTSETET